VAFSADGQTLATGSLDSKVLLWKAATGEKRQALRHDSNAAVNSLSFSPDGKWLAGATAHLVPVWAEPVVVPRRTLAVDTSACVAFSPDGKTLATCAGKIKLWDQATGQERLTLEDSRSAPTGGYPSQPSAVSFSSDGKRLAGLGTSPDRAVTVWDAATGQVRHALSSKEFDPQRMRSPLGVACRPGSTTVAVVVDDGTLRWWDPEAGQPARVFRLGPPEGLIRQLAFSPDGEYLATANGNGTVFLLRPAP
jgi:WD40 repeat protein